MGMVACQQQDQAQIVETVTPVTKPTPKPRPVVKPRPVKVKPAAPAPVVMPVVPPPAEPEKEVVEVTNPESQTEVQPVRLKPLGKRVCQLPMKGKYVALTFDDGPHASLTPKALDILKRHGAKGTFFVLGSNVARNKSVVARAAAEGHELGVHTWSHIKMNSTSRAKVDSEVSRTQNLVASISGTYPRVMRPPYGATNKTLVEHMYKRYGMASVLWDVDTLDWKKPGVEKVIQTAVSKAHPGSIILVHDIHASTLNALEGIVTGLQARGYQLVTVSELMMISKREAEEAAAAEAAAQLQEQMPSEQTIVPAEPEPQTQPEQSVPVLTEQEKTDLHAACEAEQPLKLENYTIPALHE